MERSIVRLYKKPAYNVAKTSQLFAKIKPVCPDATHLETEAVFYIEIEGTISNENLSKLKWLLSDLYSPENLTDETSLKVTEEKNFLFEIGPRFNFSTSKSTNSIAVCQSLGITNVIRLEVSRRFLIHLEKHISEETRAKVIHLLHDRMTECLYTEANIPKKSFNENLGKKKEDFKEIDVLGHGKDALKEIDRELGLAFDEADLEYYTNLFKNILKRNPTSVECFDLAQSNSEHSRHWFFKGEMVIDGAAQEQSLIELIMETQNHTNPNNVIKFSDNSSAIKGFIHSSLKPSSAGKPCEFKIVNGESHLIFTAETHNFPTGVAPFSGATTGTGGRIRDVQSVGRGGYCIAGTAGYCVGNLNLPNIVSVYLKTA